MSNESDNLSPSHKKIFTCVEIEQIVHCKKSLQRRLSSYSVNNLKHVDSAIVHLSSNENLLTRYDRADLMEIRDVKLSQEPPRCYYDPNIIKLNILKFRKHNSQFIEEQVEIFREKLKNLTVNTSFDPNLAQLLRNYHNAILNPVPLPNLLNDIQSPVLNPLYMPQANPFQGSSPLDKIPAYDRNLNFFDNITTTATMRPQRNQSHPFNQMYPKRTPYVRKPTSCANERSASSESSSIGYYSGNESKFDETSVERSTELANNQSKKAESLEKLIEEDGEPEPEWFSFPASRSDVIDLHGFEEDDQNGKEPPKQAGHKAYNGGMRYNQGVNSTYNNNNAYRRPNYNTQSRYNYNQNNATFNQKMRNQMHYSKVPPNAYNFSRSDLKAPINPFFEMWKNSKLQQENLNFINLMSRPNIPPNSNVVSMADLERAMKQNSISQNMTHQQHHNMPYTPSEQSSVSQFFQNAQMRPSAMAQNRQQQFYDGYQQNGIVMPTQEQLQQHTSEILRAAIMRKNQQYHDENKFQK